MKAILSVADLKLIGAYAELKGWRYTPVDVYGRTAGFRDKNEKYIKKRFPDMAAELEKADRTKN